MLRLYYGSEFAGRVIDVWVSRHGIQLDFVRAGKPVEDGFINSFNRRLREECLNVEVFFTIEDVREKLARWQEDCRHHLPHSLLQDKTSAAFAACGTMKTVRAPPSPEILEPVT